MVILLYRSRSFWRLIVQLLLAVAIFVPLFRYQLHIARQTELNLNHNTLPNLASYLLGSFEYFAMPLPRIQATIVLRGGILAALIVGSLWTGYRYRHQWTERHRFALVYTGLNALGLGAFIYLTRVARAERYAYILAVPSIVAWSLLLDLIQARRIRRLVWAISLLLCLASLVMVYRPMCKSGDWIRVASHIKANEKEDQPVVAFPAEVGTLLDYYYDGANAITPVPGPQRFDRFSTNDFRIPDRSVLQEVLFPILNGKNQLTLVTFNPAIFRKASDDPLNFAVLQAFLAEDFEEVARQEFIDTTVRVFRRRSGGSSVAF